MFIYYKIINGNTRLSVTILINILKRLMPAQLDPLPVSRLCLHTQDAGLTPNEAFALIF